ncbi:T9SS type A sorting domain-containing protein [Dyadobacter jiangsuensis]
MPITILPNGHYLVGTPLWNNGTATRAGALTWGDATEGVKGPVSSNISLVGTTKDDEVGWNAAILSNGNYVTRTLSWDFGAVPDVGAVTWGSANGGVKGTVSIANSLVGERTGDQVGFNITPLTNGNYVIGSPSWDNGEVQAAGAVTLCNGVTGTTGLVTISNSLVGSRYLDQVGSTAFFGGALALPNGNYVVSVPTWDNGFEAQDAGAVTWGSGVYGVTGTIDGTNSLIGTVKNEKVGDRTGGGVVLLANGNYVVASAFWNNGAATKAGAVTWADGSTGIAGTINSANSMIGSHANDQVGSRGVTVLSNGNYVICSPLWDNGIKTDAGAATWGNGATGTAGIVSGENSLVGSTTNDQVGNGRITPLSNDNYVVQSYLWDNGAAVDAGAITWANGITGISGTLSSSNSLVGSTSNDWVGFNQQNPLSSGNYVLTNYLWDNGGIENAGAITWMNGLTGITGTINAANSLVGTTAGDQLGFGGVKELSNGNYLVRSARWRNGGLTNAGAITWADGSKGITGNISESNSLIGSAAGDQLGSGGVTPVENGNYIIDSPDWDNDQVNTGAITFGTGTIGTNGAITACNSVLGASGNVLYNRVYNSIIVNQFSNNKFTVFNPSGMPLAESEDASFATISGAGPTPIVVSSECKIIATLAPAGVNGVKGAIEAKTWVENSIPALGGIPLVARHYQITPQTAPTSATGRVTLYFTQQDFDDFNADPNSKDDLPAHSSDATGKEQLTITKFSGVSSDGSGLPGTYDAEGKSTINPEDKDIVWNPTLQRWEVSFEVTGFSVFFVSASKDPLPVRLISFTARAEEQDAVLSWSVADPENFSHFEVHRSSNGRQFSIVDTIGFNNTRMHYDVVDQNAGQNAGMDGNIYYRLKMIDLDGTYAFSNMKQISMPVTERFVYPNPASQRFWLNAAELRNASSVQILNSGGQIMQKYAAGFDKGFELAQFQRGIYQVRVIRTDGTVRVFKLVAE